MKNPPYRSADLIGLVFRISFNRLPKSGDANRTIMTKKILLTVVGTVAAACLAVRVGKKVHEVAGLTKTAIGASLSSAWT